MLEGKRCQNPPVWVEKEQEKGSPTSLHPKGKAGGAGGHFGGSELCEGLGTEQKHCRPRCHLTGTKTFPSVPEGVRRWQWHLRDALLHLGWGFFPAIPSKRGRALQARSEKAMEATHAKT